jgi:hypothetical protein
MMIYDCNKLGNWRQIIQFYWSFSCLCAYIFSARWRGNRNRCKVQSSATECLNCEFLITFCCFAGGVWYLFFRAFWVTFPSTAHTTVPEQIEFCDLKLTLSDDSMEVLFMFCAQPSAFEWKEASKYFFSYFFTCCQARWLGRVWKNPIWIWTKPFILAFPSSSLQA